MRSKRLTVRAGVCMGLTFLLLPFLTGNAETGEKAYPARPIKIMVGWNAGGGSDTWTRATASLMEKKLNVPMVIVNKPGGGSLSQLQEVMTTLPADGYTISQIEASTVTNRARGMEGPDLRADMAILGGMSYQGYFFGARADTKIMTLKDFVEECKAKPGKIRVGISSAYGAQSTIVNLLKVKAKIDFQVVAFGSDANNWKELLGGRIDFASGDWGLWMPYIGPDVSANLRLRPLAVAANKRFPGAPEIPTYRDFGYDVVFETFHGLAVRKDTPRNIVERLRSVFQEMGKDPEYTKILDKIGRNGMEYRTPDEIQKMAVFHWDMTIQQMKMEEAAKKAK